MGTGGVRGGYGYGILPFWVTLVLTEILFLFSFVLFVTCTQHLGSLSSFIRLFRVGKRCISKRIFSGVGPQEPSVLPLDVWGIRTRGRAVAGGNSVVFQAQVQISTVLLYGCFCYA